MRNEVKITLLLTLSLVSAINALPMMNVTGFAWAENLVFMPNGLELFASDATTGHIYKITLNQGEYYEKTLWVNSFSGACGFALPDPTNVNTNAIYVSATDKKTKQPGIFLLDSNTPNSVKVLGYTEKQGNGVTIHHQSNTLYFTNEGRELPGNGWIYAMSAVYKENTLNTATIVEQLYSADGCEVDQVNNLLYVSSVAIGYVSIYSIDPLGSLSFLSKYKAPVIWLDDFALTDDCTEIYGTDYRNKTIVSFNARDGSNSAILFETPFSPTSVRFGVAPNFNSTAFYVSMGGGLTKFVDDRGILQGPSVL